MLLLYVAKGIQNSLQYFVNCDFALEPPQLIRESPPESHVIEGNDLHLDARVQGYPYPWVTWSHNDLLLQNNSNVDSETRLKIRKVTVLNGGLYTCYAKNPSGHDMLIYNVYVEGTDFICS